MLYDAAREAFGNGELSWRGRVRCVLVAAGYEADYRRDKTLADIPEGARLSTSPLLEGKTNKGGVMDAKDVTFERVTGDSARGIVLYEDTGDEKTARLIAHIRQARGLPMIPNGGDLKIRWDNGPNRIFKL